MKGYLIDVHNGRHGGVEINDSESHLEQFYRLIDCRCIDIAVRKIGGRPYNIVVDDEGLLVDDPIVSAIDGGGRGMLVGNLPVFGMADDMDLATLTPDDIHNIKDNLMTAIDADNERVYPVAMMGY